jgi:hypothetical protein
MKCSIEVKATQLITNSRDFFTANQHRFLVVGPCCEALRMVDVQRHLSWAIDLSYDAHPMANPHRLTTDQVIDLIKGKPVPSCRTRRSAGTSSVGEAGAAPSEQLSFLRHRRAWTPVRRSSPTCTGRPGRTTPAESCAGAVEVGTGAGWVPALRASGSTDSIAAAGVGRECLCSFRVGRR